MSLVRRGGLREQDPTLTFQAGDPIDLRVNGRTHRITVTEQHVVIDMVMGRLRIR